MEGGSKALGRHIEISWKTIFKLLLGVLLAYVVVKLWPFFKLVIVSILVAVALYRIVSWLCDKGWPRWLGLLTASAALIVAVVGLFGLIGPMAFGQASTVGKELPKLKEQIAAQLPHSGPLGGAVQKALNSGTDTNSQKLLGHGLNAMKTTLGGLFYFALMIVLAIYFMADGPRALAWLVAFFPLKHRARVSRGLAEIGKNIVAYVTGQFITSALFAAYAFVVLSILRVPTALLLAVLAGVFDILPMIGIILAVLPAALMGLTVSPATAGLVLLCYGAYHLLEDYLIIPKVYGKKLKLSNLAVLLAFTVGGVLAGVVGAVAALPLVAAYPALERLWLASKLEPEVIEEHQRLRAA
ncbi:MAG TPA: AI-2E family transporter [Candidatus Limnocylindrales bacterium]|jgi:predicted PurR-regulated permease PerM|nr:AI-2E family transporter [Candidatus Limnocylindrales bacterium]